MRIYKFYYNTYMKSLNKQLLIVVILLFFASNVLSQVYNSGYQNVVNQTSQTNITTNLNQFEALGLKRRGNPGLQNTFNWLKNKYLSYGYSESQIQTYTYTYSGSTEVCENLEVTKIGTLYPTTFIIICGHYDTIAGSGTNDNGSGVVSILEAARLLQNIPTEYSIKFVNFSGEEDGLKGSQHYVSNVVNATNPKMNIRLVFNLDEVGGVSGMVNNTITCERDNSTPTTNNAASNTFTNQLINCVELYTSLNTFLSYAYASDYMPFQSNNEVITGFFETNETTHKHTATDLLVNMDPVYNFNVAKATVAAALHFAIANTSTLLQDEFNNDFQVSFFPNPTKEILNINTGKLPLGKYNFSLIDVNGKTVFNTTIDNKNPIEQINIGNFSDGIYIGIIENDSQLIRKKIVIK